MSDERVLNILLKAVLSLYKAIQKTPRHINCDISPQGLLCSNQHFLFRCETCPWRFRFCHFGVSKVNNIWNNVILNKWAKCLRKNIYALLRYGVFSVLGFSESPCIASNVTESSTSLSSLAALSHAVHSFGVKIVIGAVRNGAQTTTNAIRAVSKDGIDVTVRDCADTSYQRY